MTAKEERHMTTRTLSGTRINSDLLAIALVAFVGASLVFVAGFASAAAVHETGHDTRHSIAFPCH
jgi:cobalt transporter subunit CbtB